MTTEFKGKYGKLLTMFCGQMEHLLYANDFKTGWHSLTNTSLLYRLKQEVKELESALINGESGSRVLAEAADVANFAMFIADNNRDDGISWVFVGEEDDSEETWLAVVHNTVIGRIWKDKDRCDNMELSKGLVYGSRYNGDTRPAGDNFFKDIESAQRDVEENYEQP